MEILLPDLGLYLTIKFHAPPSKLKVFADEKLNWDKNDEIWGWKTVDNVGKGENAGYNYFYVFFSIYIMKYLKRFFRISLFYPPLGVLCGSEVKCRIYNPEFSKFYIGVSLGKTFQSLSPVHVLVKSSK